MEQLRRAKAQSDESDNLTEVRQLGFAQRKVTNNIDENVIANTNDYADADDKNSMLSMLSLW